MKIAVWHNLASGGAKRALYYHVKGLVERGHTLECWCLSSADRSYLPLQEFIPEHVIPFEWKAKALPHHRVGQSIIGRSLHQYKNEVKRMEMFDQACQRCAEEIEAGQFDLLFANSSVLYYMPFITRHLRMPKVLYLQEPFRPLYEASPRLPWIASVNGNHSLRPYLRMDLLLSEFLSVQALRIQAEEEWINAHSCDTILVNSYYSRESVLRAYGRDAKVCYLGIDTNLFRHLHRERDGFIVGLGSFDRIKGIDLAIKTIALLPQPRPPLVWIANSGEEAYRTEMERLAESAGVNLQVKMRVSDAELVETLNRASVMLYASKLEPFGLAPLEANACATPVVAVAEGGVRETIKDGVNGFLVDREPEAIAQRISQLLHNPTLAREMGENAAHYVQQEWSLERSVDRLEARLLQAVTNQTGPVEPSAESIGVRAQR